MAPEVLARRAAERVSLRKWCWLGCALALSAFSVRAEAPPPPQEFWSYLMEFGDANGDVFDPNDLAIATHVQPKKPDPKKSAQAGQPNATGAVEQPENDPAAVPAAPGEISQ